MRRIANASRSALLSVFFGFVTASIAFADAATLAKIDNHRVPFDQSEVGISARISDGGTKDFIVYLNERNESVVKMLTGSENGRYVLITDTLLYLHIPSTSRPVRISPLQRLVGEANFGDIGRLKFAQGYKISGRQSGELPSSLPRNLGFRIASGPLEKIELEAKNRSSTYAKIDLWVTQGSLVPVRADFFLVSGKHIKTAWFARPEPFADRSISRRMAIGNPSAPHKWTVIMTNSAKARQFSRRDFSVNGFVGIN